MSRRPFLLIAFGAACAAAAACGSKAQPVDNNTGAPNHGVVPADLRDVERDGEGLVNTTFGSSPDRKPDWVSAASVFSVLKIVWGRAKSAYPGLPAVGVKAMDDAIAKLGPALAAKDQKTAANAANAIGLAVPALFSYFDPAVNEVVTMDAVFRQVGLDAHFGAWDAAAADLASMKASWAKLKDGVGTRAPKCHRVSGTATVSGDVDASLANLAASIPKKDGAATEAESDNGALEIDIVELLFDCPPDGAPPATGIGAVCKQTSDCSQGQACDPANGKCAPDSTTAKIGTPCTTTVDCGTDPRSACLTAAGDGWPGGYCGMEPCNDVEVCPVGATCVSEPHETPGCHKSCKQDSDCRGADGYVCQLYLTNPPGGFGPETQGCGFKCKDDSTCNKDMAKTLHCDVTSGHCKETL